MNCQSNSGDHEAALKIQDGIRVRVLLHAVRDDSKRCGTVVYWAFGDVLLTRSNAFAVLLASGWRTVAHPWSSTKYVLPSATYHDNLNPG